MEHVVITAIVSLVASLAFMCATLLVMCVVANKLERKKMKDEQGREKTSRSNGADAEEAAAFRRK